MEETSSSPDKETMDREAPQLAAVLKEMKEGLDTVKAKVQALTAKIRPVDKKLQYQIQKLTTVGRGAAESTALNEKETDAPRRTEDLLKYRPNPDMLVSKSETTAEDGGGIYKPPKFAPASMGEDKMSRRERNALRKEKETLRQARQSDYVRELMDDLQGRPEEVREVIGTESRELTTYKAKWEERARREEELFTRAPVMKLEKKKEKHLLKSRNGLLGLSDSFYDEIKTLPLEDDGEKMSGFGGGSSRMRKFTKRKRKH
ncbi:hypothetical protein BT93_F1803 [Corymbia citriodora subsp. variegata]|nr:hypothetical protein BT93_F1803 [Corymbia citriodora subsp. variegata]KAF8024736.1 hypothetical protein BT93_F1803 [Corymbia citriodora subsp. variegata]KAF8024737.1 hypothetical protein BT93_F1803 [Corymbia citriodora subsp. variegata]